MSKRTVLYLAMAGMVIFVGGLVLALALGQAAARAATMDEGDLGQPGAGPVSCAELELLVAWPERVMSENQSQVATLTLIGGGEEVCEAVVTLSAPDFVVSPPDLLRTVAVGPGEEVELAWVLQPRGLGTFALLVEVNGRSETYGITVTNVLGLTAFQARLLSALGAFLGPMLTAPWWYEQWQAWRREKQAAAERAALAEAARKAREPRIPFE